jgi:mycothiol S-conjugate amidase
VSRLSRSSQEGDERHNVPTNTVPDDILESMHSCAATYSRRAVLASGAAGLVWAGFAPLGSAVPAGTDPAHVDVLFVGAHPDDEYLNLSAFGQWRERCGVSVGVVTITRGEGGGNAVGPQEGPELGLIREAEERRATALAGIRDIFYLDKVDFWYTLSAPLTAAVWDERDTLQRVVRLIRTTTPHTIVVMDPRPFNQHGGHQVSARLAIEAFNLAGDALACPGQLLGEGLRPWRPTRLLAQNFGFAPLLGPQPAAQRQLDPHTGLPVCGVWSGTWSREHKTTWAQVQRNAARMYRTQGFTALPPQVPADPGRLDSAWFTVLADDGRFLEAPVRRQGGLAPLYAEFQRWTDRVGLPWLANEAQPHYPPNPATTIAVVATAPLLDGVDRADEYPGPELPLRFWQGMPADADLAATAKVSRHADDLYVLVKVIDNRESAAVARGDVKRLWRADSVEIDLDPRGDAIDTSTTFKTGIVPYTADHGGPAADRDADNRQGPVPATAPGLHVASAVAEPYTGYTVEAKIPLRDLPAAADPEKFAMNILVYDFDTESGFGEARLAWSPYGSAQADPLVWGTARLAGYRPPAGRSTVAETPVIPDTAARSADSPATLAQARRTGVPIAGNPR